MAHPSWCGSGYGFTDETGMPWHSGSSVLGARGICQAPGAAQQLQNGSFFLVSSLTLGPCHCAGQCIVICPDMGVTILCHVVGMQPCTARTGDALHVPVCSEGEMSLCELHSVLSSLLKLGWVSACLSRKQEVTKCHHKI